MNIKGTLIFFCGKMGAGKLTYAKKMANELSAVFLSEDAWLSTIYLKANDQLCFNRIEQRRKRSPERARFDTEEIFHQVTSYFQEPAEDEGFNIEVMNQRR